MKEDKKHLVNEDFDTIIQLPGRKAKPRGTWERHCLIFVMVASVIGIVTTAAIIITLISKYPEYVLPKFGEFSSHPDLRDPSLVSNGSCAIPKEARTDCKGTTEAQCNSFSCCWKPVGEHPFGPIPWCFNPIPAQKCLIPDPTRVDCYPEPGADPGKCKAKGCCWVPASSSVGGIPYCFYPADTSSGYNMSQPQATSYGYTATLTRNKASHWPDDVMSLRMDVMLETKTRAHFKIYDPNNKRYEVPVDTPKVSGKASQTDYRVDFQQAPAGLAISRTTTGTKLFDTTKYQLTFADQFIQLSSRLPTKYLYGLGEHRGQFWLDGSTTKRITFWARDVPPQEDTNLYGTHPFFIALEEDGNAYGVFLLNSNAMDVFISRSTITYKTIGGILDFWVFTGPTPDDVIMQYNEVIGRPIMPPYWSLGYHLCRWGYGGSVGMKKVIARMRKAQIPYDTQWNDIDYMKNHYDWTYDTVNYGDLPQIVEDLHNNSQHYVMIVDVGIPNIKGYEPFDSGLTRGIFVEMADGSGPVIGKVWPGTTAYPDFSNPASYEYWYDLAKSYRDIVPYDGMWIDMNEPSSFVPGSTKGCPGTSKYDNPPYVPGVLGGTLRDKTICPSSKQNVSVHYNIHSLYGHFEIIRSNKVMTTLTGKRPFLLSRSTFAGSGQHGFHWLGDNNADWMNIYYSIPGILNFNMFGIPFVGADVCGFQGVTTAELCTRWTQLGAFYPFMRNHNMKGSPDQDPAYPGFPQQSRDAMRKAILLRYSLLPTLYSLLYQSHVEGRGVARPLFFQYPKDSKTYVIDKQFLWGDTLLISPVITMSARSVTAYFPSDVWYDYTTGKRMNTTGQYVSLDAPLDRINVHMRGGTIVVTQGVNVTTVASRKNKFGIVAALPDSDDVFSTQLYWDDGESLMPKDGGIGNLISISAGKSTRGGMLSGIPVAKNYTTAMTLGSIRVLGVHPGPSGVIVNGMSVNFVYDAANRVLSAYSLSVEMLKGRFKIEWQ